MKHYPNIVWILILCLFVTSCAAGDENAPPFTTLPASPSPLPTQTSPPDPTQTNTPLPLPTAIPTAIPISESEYQGWWTYTSPDSKFSLKLPTDWVVDETTTGDTLMDGHSLKIRPQDGNSHLLIRMTFRDLGEDYYIWPTGVGSGEFLEGGSLVIAGEPAKRRYFVCPTGEVNSIWYMGTDTPNLQRESLEIGFIYTYFEVYCNENYSLGWKEQHIGELIISSLQVP